MGDFSDQAISPAVHQVHPPLRIGSVVHYVSRGSADGVFSPACRAATVTEIHDDDTVSLCVLNPTGISFHDHLEHDEDTRPGGTWHWPETA